MESFEEFAKNTLIVMTTFNRGKMTKLSLQNIDQSKFQASLAVLDDHSSEYSLDELKSWAPTANIVRPEKKSGINKLRVIAHQMAFGGGYKYVYHVDNDSYHDPLWLHRLYEMRGSYSGLLCLYNTIHHRYHTISETSDCFIRKTTPGLSFFYEVSKLTTLPENFYNSWDFVFGDILGPSCVSKVSYVEHFGAGGIHNNDFNRDRADNPTVYLKEKRDNIIKELTQEKSHGL